MIYKDIINSNYKVSESGDVLNVKFNRLLKPYKESNGYLRVALSINGSVVKYSIHRLVAEYFIPNNLNKPCVNHKNGVKTDNVISNLEWCTHSENETHSRDVLNKKYVSGDKLPQTKLNIDKVLNIKERLKNGDQVTIIAKDYNVTRKTICAIKHNRSWKHVKYE